ncbi:hypothetical protein CFP56_039597 [Quercus suber]|uniref:Uncharacterized protein n=1 Tax=Quercus suber TaxID=58331 RepID=A0AAW0IZM5_QUESU
MVSSSKSYNLLKWHKHAHQAAVKALESGGSLSVVIRRIEKAMSSSIAAEALVYGEAEVGKNDENLFISVFCCNHHYL